jgi:hypothetical protein
MHYDKPLSLRLQWILKEMREKSSIIGYKPSISTTTIKNPVLITGLKLNLTDDFDDYPSDNEFDYSDYAYEDPIDGSTSSTRKTTTTISSTTIQSSSILSFDDNSMDDTNTVSYYDYGEQDIYIDDEFDDALTKKLLPNSTTTTTTTTIIRIPSYHQRQPVIWNIDIDDTDDLEQLNSSSLLCSSYLFVFLIFIIKL